MKGLILEFSDSEVDTDDDAEHVEWMGSLQVPRAYYPHLLEAAREVRMDWLFREGVEFLCETCKSFIVPAGGLLRLLKKAGRARDRQEHDDVEADAECWRHCIEGHLIASYSWTHDEWLAFREGTLQHVRFIYDERGELTWSEQTGYPLVLAVDEVVFKFRMGCVCDALYRRMFTNLARAAK